MRGSVTAAHQAQIGPPDR